MIYPLLTFGGILFWAAVLIYSLIVTYSVNSQDSIFRPALWTTLALGATYAFTDAPVPDLTWTNIAVLAASYLGIGVVWSSFKWIQLVFKIRNFRNQYKPVKNDSDPLERAAHKRFQPNDANYQLTLPPVASDFQTRISTWVIYWPASVLATLVGDLISPALEFLSDLGGKIAKALSGTFSVISRKIYES